MFYDYSHVDILCLEPFRVTRLLDQIPGVWFPPPSQTSRLRSSMDPHSLPRDRPKEHDWCQVELDTSMAAVNHRIAAVELSLFAINVKLNEMNSLICSSNLILSTSSQSYTDNIQERVEKMELLLLRTSLKDFEILDRDIVKLLPKLEESIEEDIELENWRQQVQYPILPKPLCPVAFCDICNGDGSASCIRMGNDLNMASDCKCVIGEELELIIVGMECEFQTLRHLYDTVRATQDLVTANEWQIYDDYMNLIFAHFDGHINESMKDPQTSLNLRQFDKQENDFHRHRIWYQICDKYCGGSKDPLMKSDRFLLIAELVYCVWCTI